MATIDHDEFKIENGTHESSRQRQSYFYNVKDFKVSLNTWISWHNLFLLFFWHQSKYKTNKSKQVLMAHKSKHLKVAVSAPISLVCMHIHLFFRQEFSIFNNLSEFGEWLELKQEPGPSVDLKQKTFVNCNVKD